MVNSMYTYIFLHTSTDFVTAQFSVYKRYVKIWEYVLLEFL